MAITRGEAPLPGSVIDGKYVLRDKLGEGGMGVVFLADQPALARTVAIKILHPQLMHHRDLVVRFREEAVAASRVRHHGSVMILDRHQLPDGTPYIVMDHVRGRSLGRVIADEPIAMPRAIALVEQILDVLDAAHREGVVHGDVKSDNFLVDSAGDRDHVTMIDFGLARLVEIPTDRLLRTVVSGTPEYMAPEVVRGEPALPASDLYGVGVILYELLAGATPFCGGPAAEVMTRQLDDIAIPPSLRQPDRDIPPELDRVVLRALAKHAADRFADAAEFSRALRAATSGPQPVRLRPSDAVVDAIGHDEPTRSFVVRLRTRAAG